MEVVHLNDDGWMDNTVALQTWGMTHFIFLVQLTRGGFTKNVFSSRLICFNSV